jgi:hypothetical protein
LWAAAVAGVVCPALAACGSGSGGTSAHQPAASLTIAYSPGGPGLPGREWTLTCGPAGGNHPHRAQACRELGTHGNLLSPPERPCTLLLRRNSPQSLVRGRIGIRGVDRLVRPGCDAAWHALHALVTGA